MIAQQTSKHQQEASLVKRGCHAVKIVGINSLYPVAPKPPKTTRTIEDKTRNVTKRLTLRCPFLCLTRKTLPHKKRR